MKDIRKKIVALLKSDYCVPQLARLAKTLKEPSTTLHYNIKQLEKDETIKSYKAVFDYKKIDEGFCAFVLINLESSEYTDPDKIAKEFTRYPEIESVDIITGDWEILLKIRAKDQDEYYNLVKTVLSRKGISRIKTLTSLKQLKTEFVSF